MFVECVCTLTKRNAHGLPEKCPNKKMASSGIHAKMCVYTNYGKQCMLGECEQRKRNMPVGNLKDIKTTHSKFQDHIPNFQDHTKIGTAVLAFILLS